MEQTIRKNRILTVIFSFIIAAVIITAAIFGLHELKLYNIQRAAVAEAEENVGSYDAEKIILQNTTKEKAEAFADKIGGKLRITKDGSYAAITLPEGVKAVDILSDKSNRKYIEDISLDRYASLCDVEEEEPDSKEYLAIRPNYDVTDDGYTYQTYLDYLNMSNVWDITKGSGITVAVIDTGIDTDHPEFAGKISEYSYYATEDKIVKDYTAEGGGYDWSLIEDEQGHGTAVAGVIAASMDGAGTVGIAPDVTLLVIKCKATEGGLFVNESDLIFGLAYAVEQDVDVVNMSFVLYDRGFKANPFEQFTRLAVDSDIICVQRLGQYGCYGIRQCNVYRNIHSDVH